MTKNNNSVQNTNQDKTKKYFEAQSRDQQALGPYPILSLFLFLDSASH